MRHYILYFLMVGATVALASYVGSRSGILWAFVATLPIMFLWSAYVMRRAGGPKASLAYVKRALKTRSREGLLITSGLVLIWLPEPTIISDVLGSILILCALLTRKRSTLVSSSGVIVRNGHLPAEPRALALKAGR
jgi:hypothetical protein